MKLVFSCAIVLHRVFDSRPPEREPVFYAQGKTLRPYHKAAGLYVFVDELDQAVDVLCAGYRTERVETKQGETIHCCLYPDGSTPPPPGWSLTMVRAPPGELLFWADSAFDIRLLECNCGEKWVRLRAVPGFIGGCLRFSGGSFTQLSVILGKEPPDRYYLSNVEANFLDCRAEKGYAARADADGAAAVLSPTGFSEARGND